MATGPQRPPFPPPRRAGEYVEVKRTEPVGEHSEKHDAPVRAPMFLSPELQKLRDEMVKDAVVELKTVIKEIFTDESSVSEKQEKAAKSKRAKPPADPSNSNAALTRSQATNRKLRISVTVLIGLTSILATGAANLWSYIQGYAQDKADRALEIEAAKELHDRVEQHEARLAEIVDREQATANSIRADLGGEIRAIVELQALEAEYTNQVLEALVTRRKIPAKSRRLVDAEAAAARR